MFDRLLATSNKPRFKSEKDLEPIECNFSGVKFRFVLPRQDDEFPPNESKRSFNVFDESEYVYELEDAIEGKVPGSKVGVSHFGVPRVWRIYGEFWRSRPISEFGMAATVIDFSKVTDDLDCLEPTHFESLIDYYNYYLAGPGRGEREWISPLKWQIRKLGGYEWIYFETWPRRFEQEELRHFYAPQFDSTFYVRLFFPLFRDKCLHVGFWSHSELPNAACNNLKFRRIEAILNSFELELPTSSQRDGQLDNKRGGYSKERGPAFWDYPKRNSEEDDFDALFTMPPQLNPLNKEIIV